MSDKNIDQFFPLFAKTGAHTAFLVPTPTGYEKSIMDATAPVRDLFKSFGVHDYASQLQGPSNKVIVKSYFVYEDKIEETKASLYRPVTKKGDPRIWFYGLPKYCFPRNLLSLIIINKEIYVINLSNDKIAASLMNGGYVFDIVSHSADKEHAVVNDLLKKIWNIHKLGLIRSVTPGDPGVGDTLESTLGISRNNSKTPDYQGIELKAHRTTRAGKKKPKTRNTLFTRVPDSGLTYSEILKTYGKVQIPKNNPNAVARLQLYETLWVSRANAYGLQLYINQTEDKLDIRYKDDRDQNGFGKYVSSWDVSNLKQALLTKHPETFWVGAYAQTDSNGNEWFRYDTVDYTKNPNASLLIPLFEEDKITIDLAAHIDLQTGKYRDHGVLFKMKPDDLHLLFSDPIHYDLESMTF